MANAELTSDEIALAIRDILTGGQSVQVGDRMYTAANLDSLRKLHAEVAAAERAKDKRMFTRATFGRLA